MRITAHTLKNLPVETRDGHGIGRLSDFEMDPSSHLITTYLIRPSTLVRPLTRSYLRIDRSQVVEITDKKMVVDDSVGQQRAESDRHAEQAPKSISVAISTRFF